jgi:hypothetical protein
MNVKSGIYFTNIRKVNVFFVLIRNNIAYGNNYKSGDSPKTDAPLICADCFLFPDLNFLTRVKLL